MAKKTRRCCVYMYRLEFSLGWDLTPSTHSNFDQACDAVRQAFPNHHVTVLGASEAHWLCCVAFDGKQIQLVARIHQVG